MEMEDVIHRINACEYKSKLNKEKSSQYAW